MLCEFCSSYKERVSGGQWARAVGAPAGHAGPSEGSLRVEKAPCSSVFKRKAELDEVTSTYCLSQLCWRLRQEDGQLTPGQTELGSKTTTGKQPKKKSLAMVGKSDRTWSL